MQRYYIGIGSTKGTGAEVRELFRCAFTPTETTHGKLYHYVVGPFRTKRGAEFMRQHGHNNPHCVTVWDAERLARTANN